MVRYVCRVYDVVRYDVARCYVLQSNIKRVVAEVEEWMRKMYGDVGDVSRHLLQVKKPKIEGRRRPKSESECSRQTKKGKNVRVQRQPLLGLNLPKHRRGSNTQQDNAHRRLHVDVRSVLHQPRRRRGGHGGRGRRRGRLLRAEIII